jgi:hypothetical protein
MLRQGDVLLVPAKMSEHAKKVDRANRGIILAEGEATGHAHVILGEKASLYSVIDSSDVEEMRQRFLLVEEQVEVLHEEHATITVPPGVYEIVRQREYSPEEIRRVAD